MNAETEAMRRLLDGQDPIILTARRVLGLLRDAPGMVFMAPSKRSTPIVRNVNMNRDVSLFEKQGWYFFGVYDKRVSFDHMVEDVDFALSSGIVPTRPGVV